MVMDDYAVGSVSCLRSSNSSDIKPKRRLRLCLEDLIGFSGKKYRKKNNISLEVKSKNKCADINVDRSYKNTKEVGLKVKSASSGKKIRKLQELLKRNVNDKKSCVQENDETDLDFLDHELIDSDDAETETEKKLLRKKESSTNPIVKKDFLENTIFVGNIPINYEKRKICKIFSKFGEIQSVRIRCVPVSDINISKKVAAIKKKFNPKRKSLVAYVRFKSQDSVNSALKANGMLIDGHHLRVDSAEENKERDNNKAVFVGGLPFDTEDDELWKFFQNCGNIISVHVIRDSQTSMGKGFGYVNFDSTASVELALQLNGQEFKKRTINVQRCLKAKNKHKLNSFDKKKSKEVVNKLLCKRGKKYKEDRIKLKKEENSFLNDFQGKKANAKYKKKKKLSKAALHQRKLVKILNPS